MEAWHKFDPYGTFYIPTKHLPALLQEMEEPLGFGHTDPAQLLKVIFALNIPCHDGKVYLPEVMWPLFNSMLMVPC